MSNQHGDEPLEPSVATAAVAVGPWWLVYGGPLVPIAQAMSPCFTLIAHAGRPCVADESGQLHPGPIVVVEPGALHRIVDHRDHALVAHIDQNSTAGAALRQRTGDARVVDDRHPVSQLAGNLRPDNWSRAEEAVRRMVTLLVDRPLTDRLSWWYQPSVDEAILAADEATEIDAEWLAEQSGLDPERIRAAIIEEIGTTYTAYAEWVRLVTVVSAEVDGTRRPAHHDDRRADMMDVMQLVRLASRRSSRRPLILRP